MTCPRCRKPTDRHTQVHLGIWLVRKYPLICKACLADIDARHQAGTLFAVQMDSQN